MPNQFNEQTNKVLKSGRKRIGKYFPIVDQSIDELINPKNDVSMTNDDADVVILTTESDDTIPEPCPSPPPVELSVPFDEPIPGSLQAGEELLNDWGYDRLHELVYQYRPVLYLHGDEDHYPCDVEYYLDHAELYYGDVRLQHKVKPEELGSHRFLESEKQRIAELRAQQFDNDSINQQTSHTARNKPVQFNLRLRPDGRGGLDSRSGRQLNSVPLYAYVRRHGSGYDLVYITHYSYNGAYRIAGCIDAGMHDADFEHMTIRLNASMAVIAVWYGSHGWRDGCWRFPGQFEVEAGCRPVAYVAYHGHGLYPEPGRWWRIWGFANDVCERGPRWDAETVHLLHISHCHRETPCHQSWLSFSGWWELEGINSVHQQQWWYEEPRESNSFWRRMFCSFMPRCFGWRVDRLGLKHHNWLNEDLGAISESS